MRKLLWIAACAFPVAVLPVNAATLTLKIKSGTVSEVTVFPGTSIVPIRITGVLSGEATDGLALWGVDVTTATVGTPAAGNPTLDAPAGIMQGFKKNWGLTNPAGYGGTASGLTLLQVGGGQNTIYYHGTTPAYPMGTVVEGVADTTEEELAWGTLNTGSLPLGTHVTVTLANGFANTLNAGQAGPVYAVSPVAVVLGVPTLTVHVGWGPPMPAVITAVTSVATHGTAPGTEVSLDLGATNVEPRKVVSGDAKANAFLRVRFDTNMKAGAQSVTANPPITGITATGDGSPVVKVTFPMGLADDVCYRISLAGSVATDGGVADASQNFCVCYNVGDVNRTSPVNTGDRQLVTSVLNWTKNVPAPPPVAADPQTDINRDGIVNTGDLQLVTSVMNWGYSPAPCPP